MGLTLVGTRGAMAIMPLIVLVASSLFNWRGAFVALGCLCVGGRRMWACSPMAIPHMSFRIPPTTPSAQPMVMCAGPCGRSSVREHSGCFCLARHS